MKIMWSAATLAIVAGVIVMGLILTPFVAISDGFRMANQRGLRGV